MKLNFSNHQSVKFEITQFTQTAEQYFNAINDIRGNTSSGEEFESVVLKSLNYFFLNCVNPSHLDVRRMVVVICQIVTGSQQF
jgi:hypothetical protein